MTPFKSTNVRTLTAGDEVPGLHRLLEMLREAQLPVGPSEAIDAAQVVQHLAASVPAGEQERSRLKPMLRPALCKSVVDQAVFDDVFERWCVLPPEGSVSSPEGEIAGSTTRSGAAAKVVAPRAPRWWWRAAGASMAFRPATWSGRSYPGGKSPAFTWAGWPSARQEASTSPLRRAWCRALATNTAASFNETTAMAIFSTGPITQDASRQGPRHRMLRIRRLPPRPNAGVSRAL